MKTINPEVLWEELIEIYEAYVQENKDVYEPKAQELDGLWAGSFLFATETEEALSALTATYTKPRLSNQRAKELLKQLQTGKTTQTNETNPKTQPKHN